VHVAAVHTDGTARVHGLWLCARCRWDLVKLGYCGRKQRSADGTWLLEASDPCADVTQRVVADTFDAKSNGTVRLNTDAPTLRAGLGRSFCAHSLALSRTGAARLLRLAYPYTALMDEVLFALSGGHGEAAQRVALETAGVASEAALRAFYMTPSVFAQRSKDPTLRHTAAYASSTSRRSSADAQIPGSDG
jgi:hypothetical protein